MYIGKNIKCLSMQVCDKNKMTTIEAVMLIKKFKSF